MNVNCAICSESLVSDQTEVSATRCGHAFHRGCVQHWLRINKSCPKCRVSIKKKDVIDKLFFDSYPLPPEDDPVLLRAKIARLEEKEFDLKLAIAKVKKSSDEYGRKMAEIQFQHLEAKYLAQAVQESLESSVSRLEQEVSSAKRREKYISDQLATAKHETQVQRAILLLTERKLSMWMEMGKKPIKSGNKGYFCKFPLMQSASSTATGAIVKPKAKRARKTSSDVRGRSDDTVNAPMTRSRSRLALMNASTTKDEGGDDDSPNQTSFLRAGPSTRKTLVLNKGTGKVPLKRRYDLLSDDDAADSSTNTDEGETSTSTPEVPTTNEAAMPRAVVIVTRLEPGPSNTNN